jgi:hypothetical protein
VQTKRTSVRSDGFAPSTGSTWRKSESTGAPFQQASFNLPSSTGGFSTYRTSRRLPPAPKETPAPNPNTTAANAK